MSGDESPDPNPSGVDPADGGNDGTGENFDLRIPRGDDRPRLVCGTCGFINYVNPRIVVGAVCTWGDRILMCRRAIEPRRGYWTIPAGYLEERESVIDGAAREVREETGADVDLDTILAIYNVPRISQVQIIYRGRMRSPDLAPGPESEAADLFEWDEIPWPDLAFPSVHWALGHHREALATNVVSPFTNPSGETGDAMPGHAPGSFPRSI
jgi:ADP-ribose pyrophosphatase YjhB (NUDIX family)